MGNKVIKAGLASAIIREIPTKSGSAFEVVLEPLVRPGKSTPPTMIYFLFKEQARDLCEGLKAVLDPDSLGPSSTGPARH